MKNLGAFACALAIAFALVIMGANSVLAGKYEDIDAFGIDVAPNVLNIQSNGTEVTVHTGVAFSAVDASTVYLNGVLISSYKADNRGYFVAKFPMSEVKNLVDADILELGEITLTLTGCKKDGSTFTGEQVILVVDNLPAGK